MQPHKPKSHPLMSTPLLTLSALSQFLLLHPSYSTLDLHIHSLYPCQGLVEQHFILSWVCFGKQLFLGTLLVVCLGGVMIQKYFLICLLFTCIVLLLSIKKLKKEERKKEKKKKKNNCEYSVQQVVLCMRLFNSFLEVFVGFVVNVV